MSACAHQSCYVAEIGIQGLRYDLKFGEGRAKKIH